MREFYKYQGAGNDFVVLDNRQGDFPADNQDYIAALCQRRFGIGADGLMLLEPCAQTRFRMRYYNADGAEGSLCGNGGRCIAAFARHLGLVNLGQPFSFMAVDGIHEAECLDAETVRLQMLDVAEVKRLNAQDYFLNTGSPHYVRLGWTEAVKQEGAAIRYSSPWREQGGTNVNFIELLSPQNLRIRTYERGVEDETLACGTGVTAAAIVAVLSQGLQGRQQIQAQTLGGILSVNLEASAAGFRDIWLQGPAVQVFKGQI